MKTNFTFTISQFTIISHFSFAKQAISSNLAYKMINATGGRS